MSTSGPEHTVARPTAIERVGPDAVRIVWNDGQIRRYTAVQFRDRCPCATCREKRNTPTPPPTALTVLSAAEAQPLRILGMKPVGSYAYSIQFSDGHGTGIYPLELLRELGEEVS